MSGGNRKYLEDLVTEREEIKQRQLDEAFENMKADLESKIKNQPDEALWLMKNYRKCINNKDLINLING